MHLGTVLTDQNSDVESHLSEILESPPFRASQRSQQFLQYVVRESLSGRGDSLKERVIGEQVFGRQADYDTGQDSIVRVKANEVRRRLAQYYEQHSDAPLRIEMVSGSYGVRIRRADAIPEEKANIKPKAKPKAAWRPLVWILGAVTVLGAGWFLRPTPTSPHFETFWRPFLDGDGPLLICMPAPEAFRIYGQGKSKLVQALRAQPPGSAAAPITTSWEEVRIVPEGGLLVGLGDAKVMAMLHAFAFSRKKEVQTRLSAMTSFEDLKASPSVVIGGETNQWNTDLTAEHRFLLRKHQGQNVIWDRMTNEAVCTKPQPWEAAARSDCALVTRLRSNVTGSLLLLAAGLDHYGTGALGEFLTNPKLLQPVLESAPHGWDQKNLQILFDVERMGDGVGPPRLRTIHTW